MIQENFFCFLGFLYLCKPKNGHTFLHNVMNQAIITHDAK